MPSDLIPGSMRQWKIAGFIGTVIIVSCFPFYLARVAFITGKKSGKHLLAANHAKNAIKKSTTYGKVHIMIWLWILLLIKQYWVILIISNSNITG